MSATRLVVYGVIGLACAAGLAVAVRRSRTRRRMLTDVVFWIGGVAGVFGLVEVLLGYAADGVYIVALGALTVGVAAWTAYGEPHRIAREERNRRRCDQADRQRRESGRRIGVVFATSKDDERPFDS